MSRRSIQRHQDSLLTEDIEDDAANGTNNNNNNNSIGTNTGGNFHQIHPPATGPGTVDNEMDNNNTMRNRCSSGGMSNSSNSSNNRDNDNSNNGNNNNNNVSEYMPRMQRRRTTMITEQVGIEEINKPSIFTRIWDCSMPLFKGLIILIFIMLIIHNSSIMQEKTKEIRNLVNSFETIKNNSIRVSLDNMEIRSAIINCQNERIESETMVNELREVVTYHCGEFSGTLEEAYEETEYIYSEDHGPVNPEWLFTKNQREKEEDSKDNKRDDNNNIDDSSKQDDYNDYIKTYDINDDNNVLNERKNEINEDSERGHVKYENNDDIMDRIINSNQKENQENEYGRNNNNNNHNNDASEIIVETNY